MRRVLVVEREALFIEALQRAAGGAFELEVLADGVRALAMARTRPPEVVVYDAELPVLHGREFLRGLKGTGGAGSRVPVALTTRRRSGEMLVQSAYAGADDLWLKPVAFDVAARLEELSATAGASRDWPVSGREAARGVLAFAGRNRLSGTLWLNPGVPFEGSCTFENGRLHRASFAGLTGRDAFIEMLSFEDGAWRFDEGGQAHRPAVASDDPEASQRAEKLLVVDDSPQIRELYSARLAHAGFAVETAADGVEALERCLTRRYDLVITDLTMPRMDGWALLGRLRRHPRTREVPVIVTSANDDFREALQAARGGAWDYVSKGGDLTALVHRTVVALSPRWAAQAIVDRGAADELELDVIGARWLMELLDERKVTGTLHAADELGGYTVRVRRGTPVTATANVGGRARAGPQALRLLLSSRRGKARFETGPVEEPSTFKLGTRGLLEAMIDAQSRVDEAAVLEHLKNGTLVPDPELYALFRRVASARAAEVAEAVVEARLPIAEAAGRVRLSEVDVREIVLDMVFRGVLRVPGEDE